VGFDDDLANAQSQARSPDFRIAGVRTVAPEESLEDARQIVFGDADARVFYDEFGMPLRGVQVDPDFTIGRREFEGVVDEIVDHLTQLVLASVDEEYGQD
jgi:hypothetical protein